MENLALLKNRHLIRPPDLRKSLYVSCFLGRRRQASEPRSVFHPHPFLFCTEFAPVYV